MVKNLPVMQETQVQSLGWEDALEKGMASHSEYPCLENSLDRRAWWATVQSVVIYSILPGRRRNQWWTCGLRNGFWEGVAGALSSNLRGLIPGNAEEPRNVQNHLRPWWLGGAPNTGPSRTKAVISPAARSSSRRAEAVCLPLDSCHLRTGWQGITKGPALLGHPTSRASAAGACSSFSAQSAPFIPPPNPLQQMWFPRALLTTYPHVNLHLRNCLQGTWCKAKTWVSELSGTLDVSSLRGSHGQQGLAWETMGMSLYTWEKVFRGPHNWLLKAFKDREGPDCHYSLGTCGPQNFQAAKVLSSSLFLFLLAFLCSDWQPSPSGSSSLVQTGIPHSVIYPHFLSLFLYGAVFLTRKKL